MKNQVNVGDQNSQKIRKNRVNLSLTTTKKPGVNYLAVGAVVITCFVIFGFGWYFLKKQFSPTVNLSLTSKNNYVDDFFRGVRKTEGELQTYRYNNIAEFKYPSSYTIGSDFRTQSSGNFVIVQSPNFKIGTVWDGDFGHPGMVDGHGITFNPVKRNLPVENVIQNYWKRKNMSPYYREITLGGKKGYFNVNISDGKPSQYQASTITEDGVVYVLSADWVKEEDRQEAMNVLFVMMNSFRFIK